MNNQKIGNQFHISSSNTKKEILPWSKNSKSPKSKVLYDRNDLMLGMNTKIQLFSTLDDENSLETVPESSSPSSSLSNMEKAWRFVKKPMLRIGSKGAAPSHGNSLRELLEQHGAVKVKVNTNKLGSLEEAFEILSDLAQKSGAPDGIELLQSRQSNNIILFGEPGMMERIENGEFPPPER